MPARLVVFLTLLLAGCQSTGPWTFAVTRSAWGEERADERAAFAEDLATRGRSEPDPGFLFLLLLPPALDLAFLPVALPRDLVVGAL